MIKEYEIATPSARNDKWRGLAMTNGGGKEAGEGV